MAMPRNTVDGKDNSQLGVTCFLAPFHVALDSEARTVGPISAFSNNAG